MLIDTRDLAQGRHLRYDVCIVGAGAAGITLARALRSDHTSIGVLESGGFTFEDETQSLYRGTTEGAGLTPTYLSSSRLRFFGGTTNHWAGMCRPLDPIDFSIRPWVPHSGWPINRDDLAPYYRRAADVLQLRPFDARWGEVTLHAESLVPAHGALIGRAFRYSPPTRFGRVYRGELVEANTVDVLLHANAVHIDLNEAGTAVERIQVANLNGKRVTVAARVFVLATGGVENARLLLASNSVHRSGLGNGSDRVGRFFMEHPERVAGYMTITSPAALEDLRMLRRDRALLCLSEEAQRTDELLNTNIQIGPLTPVRRSEAAGFPLALMETIERLDHLASEDLPGTEQADPTEPPAITRLFIRAESAPRPDSRVTLEDRETDALGMRRAQLAFVMDTLESRTFVRTMEIVARELGSRQAGRLMMALAEGADRVPLGAGLSRGNHHMGTTRMSENPSEGVVDRHCQIHGVSNLYVAGSSVFPTVGMANPTFTIVALALRMAEHIAARLAREWKT
jgi:choline dehydrogenase-like flavoprotein